MSRTHQPRAARRADSMSSEASIPDKLYFRIGEVSKLARTKPYVLRYWETEFPTLRPTKSRSGHRLYRRQDVETVFEIKRLLYQEGFTIEGARRQLAGNSGANTGKQAKSSASLDGQELRAIKRELRAILTMLSRR